MPVMAGLVPAISLMDARGPPKRDRRDKPGDDKDIGRPVHPTVLTTPPSTRSAAPVVADACGEQT